MAAFLGTISQASKCISHKPIQSDGHWVPGTWVRRLVSDGSIAFHHGIAIDSNHIIEGNVDSTPANEFEIEANIQQHLITRCISESLIDEITIQHNIKFGKIINHSKSKLIKIFSDLNIKKRDYNRLIDALYEVSSELNAISNKRGIVGITKIKEEHKDKFIIIQEPSSMTHGLSIVYNALKDCGKPFEYSVLFDNCEHRVLRWWQNGTSALEKMTGVSQATAVKGLLGVGVLGIFGTFLQLSKHINHYSTDAISKCQDFMKVIIHELGENGADSNLINNLQHGMNNLKSSQVGELAKISENIVNTGGSGVANSVANATGDISDQTEELAEHLKEAGRFLWDKWHNRKNKGKWINKFKNALSGNSNISNNNDIMTDVSDIANVLVDSVQDGKQVSGSVVSNVHVPKEVAESSKQFVEGSKQLQREIANKWNIVGKYAGIAIGVVIVMGVAYVPYHWYMQRHCKSTKLKSGELGQFKKGRNYDLLTSNKEISKLMIVIKYELEQYNEYKSTIAKKKDYVSGITATIPDNIDFCVKYQSLSSKTSNQEDSSNDFEEFKTCEEEMKMDKRDILSVDDSKCSEDTIVNSKNIDEIGENTEKVIINNYGLSDQEVLNTRELYKWLKYAHNINVANYFCNVINQGWETKEDLLDCYVDCKEDLKPIFINKDSNAVDNDSLELMYKKIELAIKQDEMKDQKQLTVTLYDWLKEIDCENKENEFKKCGVTNVELLFKTINKRSDLQKIGGLGGGHKRKIWKKIEKQNE